MADQKLIVGDCPERVALDLALRIERDTNTAGSSTARDEAYWLALYARALAVVRGHQPKDGPRESGHRPSHATR